MSSGKPPQVHFGLLKRSLSNGVSYWAINYQWIKSWIIDLVDRRLDQFDKGINARVDDGEKVV